jgi:hypothetical protein
MNERTLDTIDVSAVGAARRVVDRRRERRAAWRRRGEQRSAGQREAAFISWHGMSPLLCTDNTSVPVTRSFVRSCGVCGVLSPYRRIRLTDRADRRQGVRSLRSVPFRSVLLTLHSSRHTCAYLDPMFAHTPQRCLRCVVFSWFVLLCRRWWVRAAALRSLALCCIASHRIARSLALCCIASRRIALHRAPPPCHVVYRLSSVDTNIY